MGFALGTQKERRGVEEREQEKRKNGEGSGWQLTKKVGVEAQEQKRNKKAWVFVLGANKERGRIEVREQKKRE